CFTLLYMGSAVVMGLGGFCASGGPYVIETECPDSVVATVPLSIFGGLAAVAIGVIFARGFGMPLISWAWPILFVGLGLAFLFASAQPGGITFLIIGILFVAMGLFPLVLEIRTSVQSLFLGSTNIAGVPFQQTGRSRASYLQFGRWEQPDSDEQVIPTTGDWTLALGIAIVAIGLGIYFATQLFASFGG
ncbi:MAG: hypothetical protein ABUL47_07790, partial [Leifsonia sp.]